MRLYLLSIKRIICNGTLIFMFLTLGITVAVFCTGFYLGKSKDMYNGLTAMPPYSIINIKLNSDNNVKILDEIKKSYSNNVITTIYATRLKNGGIIIGWDGAFPGRWGIMSVKTMTFTPEQIESAENVVIADGYTAKEIRGQETVELNGTLYKILGIMDDIRSINAEKYLYDNPAEADSAVTYIMPYTTFLKNFAPELVMLHHAGLSPAKLEVKVEKLRADKLDAVLYETDSGIADIHAKFTEKYMSYGLALTAVAMVSVILLFFQWLRLAAHEFYVFRICGLSSRRVALVAVINWLVLYLAGNAAALVAIGVLCLAGVISFPYAGLFTAFSAGLFALCAAAAFPKIKKILSGTVREVRL